MPARVLLFTLLLAAPLAARADDLIVLLQQRKCPDCRLADVDLVHADLRDVDLSNAKLMRANLSQAQLDGADLSGADLSFTSLRGASLRGADLTGSRLYGTDLRQADLSNAHLDNAALEQSHWQGAQGITNDVLSHASLHNAGVNAANINQWREAESLFSAAITVDPSKSMSWIARGICRSELGQIEQSLKDLIYAEKLLKKEGELIQAEQLGREIKKIYSPQSESSKAGNGIGSTILAGAISTFQLLAPMAFRMISPISP